jgi:hypothetical protein
MAELRVKARGVKFPACGWLSTHATEPNENGRILVEVRGHCGHEWWTELLMTTPADAFLAGEDRWSEATLKDGTYRVVETKDKRGKRLLRFFRCDDNSEFVLFTIPGFIITEACEGEVVVLADAEGHSRTYKSGDRWSLVAARVGSTVAYEEFYRGDPVYAKVTEEGVQPLGQCSAVISPSEW